MSKHMLLIVSEMNLYSTSLDGGGRLCRPGFDCVDLDVNMVDTNGFQITLVELYTQHHWCHMLSSLMT